MPEARTLRVRVIEDDDDLAEILCESIEIGLRSRGWEKVDISFSGDSAGLELEIARGLVPDAVLLDYHLRGGMNGSEIAAKLRSMRFRGTIIVLTGDDRATKTDDVDAVLLKSGSSGMKGMLELIEKRAASG